MTSFLPTIMTDPRANARARMLANVTPLHSRQGTVDLERLTQSPDTLRRQGPLQGTGENKKWTQDDQDHYDEDAKQQAMDALVQSWKERLSLISVLTTFFAGMEAQLIGSTVPADLDQISAIDQATNIGLVGAMVTHVFAAVISFLAAFFLIRYKLKEATKQEHKIIEGSSGTSSTLSSQSSQHGPGIFSTNPHLEQVGPFNGRLPPTHLLRRCHSLCMWLATIGFLLAVMGIVCFAWAQMPLSVSIFSTICASVCFIAGLVAMF